MKTGALIIPTGIGASIGGYAGDAGCYARKLSKYFKLIVNPNVVNAACFSSITDNMLYVEGYTLDRFFKGEIGLKESHDNRIGIIFDREIPQNVLNIHINTINAVKAVYGTDIIGYELTDECVGVSFYVNKAGVSAGDINNSKTIKKAAERLINKGANAIAIVCLFPDEQGDDYANGIGVDPVGGVEAIISHYISKELEIPCAHAPAFKNFDITTEIVDKRCAAEYITPTFLPCILLGLSNAPQICNLNEGITVDDVDFLAFPHNSLGGIPVMEMNKRGKKIFAIKNNSTVLNVNSFNFGIKCDIINIYDEITKFYKDEI